MSPKRKPDIGARRLAYVFREMIGFRRIYCEDHQFFKLVDFWNLLTDENSDFKIKTYDAEDDSGARAAVLEFGGKFKLVVARQLLERAQRGCKLCNFTLAHEFAHCALDHHASGGIVKNFKLFETKNGRANIPPTDEELEANYAAVVFQCGIELLKSGVDALALADRAFCDVNMVRKALRLSQLPEFREELERQQSAVERVVL